jgi:hypothetical protein
MNKLILGFCVLPLLLAPPGVGGAASATEVNTLVEKLVEKGVLSREEADALIEETREEIDEPEVAPAEEAVAEAEAAPEEPAEQEADKASFALPKWVSRIHPMGDLRLRWDTQVKDKNETGEEPKSDTRNRGRFRLRFGLKSDITETVELGIRLVSGSGFQNTTNQSFDDQFRGKPIFFDLAYAQWKPLDGLTLIGGKYKNQIFTTPLVWDPDVNPEGIAESLSFRAHDRVDLFANFGQWLVEEISSENSDTAMLAFQLGTEIQAGKRVSVKLAGGYYEFLNLDSIKLPSDPTDSEEWVGYNNTHGQLMIFDTDDRLLNDFGTLEVQLKVAVEDVLPVPFSIFGSYINNLRSDIDDLVANGVPYTGDFTFDPADLAAYGSDDRETGWLVGFDVGRKKGKGDWYAYYWYQVLEDYAFPAVFVDSDFHNGGTNNRGHKLHARYYLMDQISLQATGFLTKRDDESVFGKFDEDRVQLDIVFKFP